MCIRDSLELEREAARLENRAAQLKTEETQILDKMWESYELTPTPAAEIARPIENLGETRGRVQELRVKMRALGNVNLDAVDEFQRVQERYSFCLLYTSRTPKSPSGRSSRSKN